MHKKAWLELVTSKSEGLILRGIQTEFKFVRRVIELDRLQCLIGTATDSENNFSTDSLCPGLIGYQSTINSSRPLNHLRILSS